MGWTIGAIIVPRDAASGSQRHDKPSGSGAWLTGMLTDRAFVLFDLERYEEAFDWARRARLSPPPRTMTFAVFAAVLAKLGRQDEARAAIDVLLAHAPRLSYAKYRENLFGTPKVMERLAGALREAGLPE